MPTSTNVVATADAGPSSVKGAIERHTIAVTPEAGTSAGARNQMARNGKSAEEIIGFLREADVHLTSGVATAT